MRVSIQQANTKFTQKERDYIQKRLVATVERLCKKVSEADLPTLDITVGRTTRHHRKGEVFMAEANVTIGSHMVRGKVEHEDMLAACDLLKDELVHNITADRERTRSVRLRRARQDKKDITLDPAARMWRTGRIRDEGI